ncbi:hypothetical protein [Halapricum sp. CBA1109]|uniref:hypothetical protein n=1 Tax=Halapricum sp. CBA1109 TaxID=2668068 RepID=UPI0018D25655|nr:hypothetical protein [Halapricum sp. CBA1109]
MNREQLLDGLTQDILAYVMHGSFSESHFAEEIAPEALDERFYDYESLVRLHFVLRPDVVDFIETLPSELRRIKTQTRNTSTVSRGNVDGRIHWGKTVRTRNSQHPGDRSLFVCENRTEDYDIDENIVLKRLLSVIYATLDDSREYLERDYEWVTERWSENTELVDRMRAIFERNVHVRRIRPPGEYEPTARMIRRAENSRSELYRRAATLLSEYRDALDGDPDSIRELLDLTAVTPDDDETLLELYVLFRYIATIEQLSESEFEMRTIKSAKQEVARLSRDGTDIVLYHDNSGQSGSLFPLRRVRKVERGTITHGTCRA